MSAAAEKSRSDDKAAKKAARKVALKKEAKTLGVSYEELKAQKKERKAKKKREAEQLESEEHKTEMKRMRSWSKDLTAEENDSPNKRRRTRSMDAAEEEAGSSPEAWRREHNITIRGHGSHSNDTEFSDPYLKFKDAPFNGVIQKSFQQAGFEKPTPIQSQAWPIAINGQDMICIAKTGSGKTCGFLLPSLHQHLATRGSGHSRPAGPVLLVLAPTRELACQIMEETQKFGRALGVRSVCCYGGSSKYPQIAALQRGVECIIATPGRLNDLLEMKKANLACIKYLVLDEADRMLDMGFEPQIRAILKHVPDPHQTMLFSATWPKEIQRLAHDFLHDPIQINVGEVNALVANKDIVQNIIMCTEAEKFDKLTEILKQLTEDAPSTDEQQPSARQHRAVDLGGKKHAKVIVFVAKKVSCNDLANRLWDDGFAVDSLHGDRPQWERTKVMNAFKAGTLRLLIATDVASRGLDVKDVGVVVNFDMPAGVNAVEDYVHRIGRTGRAGAKGVATTLFTAGDRKCAGQLVEVMRKANQEIPEALQAMVPRPRYGRGGGRGGRGYGGGRGGGRGYMSSGGRGGYGGRAGGRGGYGGRRGGGWGGYRR